MKLQAKSDNHCNLGTVLGGIQIRAHPPHGRGRANDNNGNNNSLTTQVHWPAKLPMSEAESTVLTEQAPDALKCKVGRAKVEGKKYIFGRLAIYIRS